MASRLWCPWQTIGSEPPLVSMSTFDSTMPVSMFTEATCAMWIVSSCFPNHRGLNWTTLVGVMATCVGNTRLPRLRRLARKTSPAMNGRPLCHTPQPARSATAAPKTSTNHSQSYSPVTNADVKLFRPVKETTLPYRAPGSPGHSRQDFLSGKPIRYYRPTGSQEIRHLIDNGFQAFNAGRLSEACEIFADKMLAPANETTIGLTVAGAMTPAGLGGCVIEMMDRGLVDFVISTGANLYHDLHYAMNFTLRRGSPFVDDRELYEEGVIRIYDVLFPATVLLETDAYIRDFIVRSRLDGPISTAEFHYRLGLDLVDRHPGCEEYSVVARAAT